jgi:hypothetical protein
MRIAVLALFICAVTCPATTLLDPFHLPQTGCIYTTSPPYDGGCDVIGSEMNYDIQMASVVISGNTATVSLYFNTGAEALVGGQMVLGSFSDAGDTLIVGDLFFYSPDAVMDPSDPKNVIPSALQYAVPLEGHNALTAGSLYQVGATETAQTALAGSSNYYRRDETVLMTSGTLAGSGAGVTVANYGDGTTSALYQVTVSFQTTDAFLSLVQNGQIGILFSSADCANDVIQGAVDTRAPEPQPLALIAGGLGLLLGVGAWRRRATRKAQAA